MVRDGAGAPPRHEGDGLGCAALSIPSLRAKRSNPECLRGGILDCFVAALLAMMGWTAPERHRCARLAMLSRTRQREPSMSKISTIGLDLAKNVFQVHGVDASGAVVVRRQLRRAAVEKFFRQLPPSLVGMEACGSAHHW